MSYLIWGVSVTRKNGNILWSTNEATPHCGHIWLHPPKLPLLYGYFKVSFFRFTSFLFPVNPSYIYSKFLRLLRWQWCRKVWKSGGAKCYVEAKHMRGRGASSKGGTKIYPTPCFRHPWRSSQFPDLKKKWGQVFWHSAQMRAAVAVAAVALDSQPPTAVSTRLTFQVINLWRLSFGSNVRKSSFLTTMPILWALEKLHSIVWYCTYIGGP